MGKILLYRPGRACVAGQLNVLDEWGQTGGGRYVHPYKGITGTEQTYLYIGTSSYAAECLNNLQLYANLTGYVSADTENDFSLDLSDEKSYAIRDVANIGYSRSSSVGRGYRIYTISATNNGSSEVTVNSIKFVKSIMYWGGSSSKMDCLVLGYFLDSPVTIGVGETKTFAINLDS